MQITVKMEGVDRAKRALDPKLFDRASRLALNEAERKARVEAKKEIRAKWNIKATKANQEVKNIKKARNSDLTAIIQAKGRPISLTYFGAKEIRDTSRGVLVQTGTRGRIQSRARGQRGVTVQIIRGRRTHLPKAFIATTKNASVRVFERMGKSRLPIESKSTITIASMFDQAKVQKATVKAAQSQFLKRFAHHWRRLVK